ncbi:VanZ family protein [Paenibacillus sp. CF384]|uniref:VanZ family protein n=1 Tax=Paenibacillus sp. CF384 TaxID=1884382 RepID=UPI000894ED3E|nr:VanZ family protein [Paenibacillus sp. CF384]SDW04550.1 VanZ like family protein [Paenibacillus sp. CF384]
MDNKSRTNLFIHGLFVLYMYALIKIILFKFGSIDVTWLGMQLKESLTNPAHLIDRLESGNLVPFKEIATAIHVQTSHSLMNLYGNILIFIPLGFFIGLMSLNKRSTVSGAILKSFGVSLCLESSQILFAIGRFDVDDLILNASGGLLGYVILQMFVWLMRAIPIRPEMEIKE